MPEQQVDVIVIGAGPAGYVAACRAAELGFDTLCIDDRASAGGTCLHVGCIPSKALLCSTEHVARARDALGAHGISIEQLSVDLEAMMERKASVVDRLTSGVDALLEKRGAARLGGRARLLGRGRVGVRTGDGDEQTFEAAHVVIATGSRSATLPDVPIDEERILSSTGALALRRVPDHLVVIGGGYIGVELGSVWSRLGAEVTIVEVEDRLLPGMDADLADGLADALREQGLVLRLGCEVTRVEHRDDGLVVGVQSGRDRGGESELRCSHLLVAVGREPATRGLGLDRAGVERTDAGFIRVDGRFRTSSAGVHAIGDVVGEPMLAHKAQLEALACMDAIVGRGTGAVDYDAIPAVVYTHPEAATVGATEASLAERGVRYRTSRASFRTDARALCLGEASGFVKLLAEEGSDRLLGAQILGPDAGGLVHELVLARALRASLEEVGRAPHAHPTLNEAVREAALALDGRALHQ